MSKITAIDYESYYDTECSITNGLENYLTHPKFDAYMVSIYSDDGFVWVGPPEKAPWEKLDGDTVLSHNRSFDQALHDHLIKIGKIKPTNFGAWHCTADMSAYCGHPRNLKGALKSAFGYEMSKEVRDNMKGREYGPLSVEEKKELAEYALMDSKGCLGLWEKEESKWPEWERQISQETTRMCWDGLPVDPEMLDAGIKKLGDAVDGALNLLPWTEEQTGALSPKEWALWCRAQGKEPPVSMAKDNPDVIKWIKENPEEGAVLEATHILRGGNNLRKKFIKMRGRVRADNRLGYGLKYFGANITGRDSGDGGFNTQNMGRKDLYGVNLRACIYAPPGKILLVADLAQIEARGAAFLAGEEDLLDMARQGLDWYEVMARQFGLYDGASPMKEHNPQLRHKMKQMCLGCQFKMFPKKFSEITGVPIGDATEMVAMFRRKMPKLVKLWGTLDRQMRESAYEGDHSYEIELPSGRTLKYRDVTLNGGLSAVIPRTGQLQRNRFWAGTLIENATQGFARDIFMDRVLALRKNDHRICLRVHDEVVIEADEDNHQDAMKDIHDVMTTSPEWCPTMPLGTDVVPMHRYTK